MDRIPFGFAVAAALLLGTPAAAQKAASPEQRATAGAPEQAKAAAELKVELAERRDTDQPVVTKRPRAARVTSCRCGDIATQQ